jgi:hypothetical protein
MRRATRHGLGVAAALAAAVCSPAAVAAQGSTQVVFGGSTTLTTVVQIPARVEGYLTVRFHGDPATGCAARGLCGYSGTILWKPPASGSLEILQGRSHGRRQYEASLFLADLNGLPAQGGAVTDANVGQTLAGPSGASQPGPSCADAASVPSNIQLPVRHGRVEFSLTQASPSPLQTRCAGPLMSDVASALAVPAPPLRATLRGALTLDLAGSHSFAAHGFSGSVDSTLTIRLGRPSRSKSVSSTPTGPTERYRELQLGYRATVAGTVTAAVNGDANQALCGPLGACGLRGTLSLVPAPGPAQGEIFALGPASRPNRDFLTALGLSTAGRANGITVFGSVAWSAGGVITADLDQGSASCRDSAGLGGDFVQFAATRHRLSAHYVAGEASGGTIRTRCPGPFAPPGGLATGSAPLSILSHRTARLSLDGGQRLIDDGYSGASTAHLPLTLTLTRKRLRTLVFGLPQGEN